METEYEHKVKASTALAELLDSTAIYCSAACCGLDAFEIHRGLLLRKIIDKNIEKDKGNDWYNSLEQEIESVHSIQCF